MNQITIFNLTQFIEHSPGFGLIQTPLWNVKIGGLWGGKGGIHYI